jgi:hypothetical protein
VGEMYRFVLASVGLCSAVVLSACPGTLSNPEDFGDGGMEVKDAETILAESCGTTGCHDDTAQAQAGLNLLSPGVANRIVDEPATGIGCTDRIIVVAGDPDSSYLIDKVLNIPSICGDQMPIVGSLDASEIEVLRQWITDLGGSSGATVDGG